MSNLVDEIAKKLLLDGAEDILYFMEATGLKHLGGQLTQLKPVQPIDSPVKIIFIVEYESNDIIPSPRLDNMADAMIPELVRNKFLKGAHQVQQMFLAKRKKKPGKIQLFILNHKEDA